MDRQNKKITELTPDQMDKVSGGFSDDERYFFCPKCRKTFRIDLYSSHTKTCKGLSPNLFRANKQAAEKAKKAFRISPNRSVSIWTIRRKPSLN